MTLIVKNVMATDLGLVGVLKPDNEGRYTVPLGIVDEYAFDGDFYKNSDKVEALFKPGSKLMERCSKGLLWVEWGHPKVAGLNRQQMLSRVCSIDEKSICGNISKIWLQTLTIDGKDTRVIMGLLTTCGPYGAFLEKMLLDPKINFGLSGRYFSDPVPNGNGTYTREIYDAFTWDFVWSPGMPKTLKYNSPTLQGETICRELDDLGDAGLILSTNAAENGQVYRFEAIDVQSLSSNDGMTMQSSGAATYLRDIGVISSNKPRRSTMWGSV